MVCMHGFLYRLFGEYVCDAYVFGQLGVEDPKIDLARSVRHPPRLALHLPREVIDVSLVPGRGICRTLLMSTPNLHFCRKPQKDHPDRLSRHRRV